jgi:hypothetical protein
MFELIATRSSPLSRVYNDLALSPLSNSSPTVAFGKARESISSSSPPAPTSDIEDTCRDGYKSAKTLTLSGGLVPVDMAPRTSLELSTRGRLRRRMYLIFPRPSSGTRARITRDRSVWVSCPVCNILCAYKAIRDRSKARNSKNALLAKH